MFDILFGISHENKHRLTSAVCYRKQHDRQRAFFCKKKALSKSDKAFLKLFFYFAFLLTISLSTKIEPNIITIDNGNITYQIGTKPAIIKHTKDTPATNNA